MAEFRDRLEEALAKCGMSPAELSRKTGIGEGAISQYRRGAYKASQRNLEKIAKALDVPIAWLMGSDDTPAVAPSAPATPELSAPPASFFTREVVRIPVLGRIPAGIPIEAIEDVIDFEEIPAAKTSGGRIYFALQVEGDSMFPRFLPGDIVIVRKTEICYSGDVCVVYVNGSDATLKEVRLDPEKRTLTIIPANTNYLPRTFSAEEIELLPVRIGGVVEELRRRPAKRER